MQGAVRVAISALGMLQFILSHNVFAKLDNIESGGKLLETEQVIVLHFYTGLLKLLVMDKPECVVMISCLSTVSFSLTTVIVGMQH